MYTFDELQKKTKVELEDIKSKEHLRISENESKRQGLIRDILILQSMQDNTSFYKKI